MDYFGDNIRYRNDSEENCKMIANRDMLNSDVFILITYNDRTRECEMQTYLPHNINNRGKLNFFIMSLELMSQAIRKMIDEI